MPKLRKSPMWDYLHSTGILENGKPEEIILAKKEYRKKYSLLHKRKHRSLKPEFHVQYSKENGEYDLITTNAKKHNTKTSTFIRQASLAYLTHSYIVPDRYQLARLEQLLSDCLNEVKAIAKSKDRFLWNREDKLHEIEKRIARMENEIRQVIASPQMK